MPPPPAVDCVPSDAPSRMSPLELRAGVSLASLFGLRMLGLFLILPVFAVHAPSLAGGDNLTLVGIALGAYGLSLGVLQLPFGMASDRFGRKPVIAVGLVIFALGSFLAASATDIYVAIAGRALQGAGAISSVAMALAEGFSTEAVGEAMALASARLVLRDPGRTRDEVGKPKGSIHGASVGVHASDSANAWRNIARASSVRNQIASMIVGAYHTAGQSGSVDSKELPYVAAADSLNASDENLHQRLNDAIRSQDQLAASASAYRYLKSNKDPTPIFQTLLQFAVSEEGSLHAEKFYRTVIEEFETTRPSFRWRHAVALARVSASEFGFPAAGLMEAKSLLQLPGQKT